MCNCDSPSTCQCGAISLRTGGVIQEDSSTAFSELLEHRLRRDYTHSQPVVIQDEPDARTVWLKVGVQSFQIATAENEEHAEWYRTMLSKALAKIVIEQKG